MFLNVMSNVVRPCRLTNEPSKHLIACLQAIMRKFSVLDMIQSVNKMNCSWIAMIQDNLKSVRSQNETGGYAATTLASTGASDSGDKTQATGSVFIETDPAKIDHLK